PATARALGQARVRDRSGGRRVRPAAGARLAAPRRAAGRQTGAPVRRVDRVSHHAGAARRRHPGPAALPAGAGERGQGCGVADVRRARGGRGAGPLAGPARRGGQPAPALTASALAASALAGAELTGAELTGAELTGRSRWRASVASAVASATAAPPGSL